MNSKLCRLALLALGVLWLSGCKLVITVPQGGSVLAQSGEVCTANSTCVVDIRDSDYQDGYLAIPAPGYVFAGWKAGDKYFCGYSDSTCVISAAPLADNPALEALLASTAELLLEPVFIEQEAERFVRSEWVRLIEETSSGVFNKDEFLYESRPVVGHCDPGVLSDGAKYRFNYAVNLVRRLHQLPPVQYDDFFSSEAQQASLLQMANRYLSHTPRTWDSCYTAAAAAGAQSANLTAGSVQRDPVFNLITWVNDAANVSDKMAAGHRRWVLYPWLGYTSYGQTNGYSAMKVFGFGRPAVQILPDELQYVAFPYREYPYVLFKRGTSAPWSLSMVPRSGKGYFNHFAYATVRVVSTHTGASLNVHSLYHDTRSHGLRNFLSWKVDGWDYDSDYTVKIRNVKLQDGSFTTIEYPVRIEYESLR